MTETADHLPPPRRLRRALAALLASGALGAGLAAWAAHGATPGSDPSRGVVDITTTLAYQDGQAAGTGMVLASSGIVLTNNHVIEGSETITVTDVGTGRRYRASVLGTDATDDVALLQVPGASGLTPIDLGDSARVKVGDAVRAVGNAGGAGGAPRISSGQVVRLRRAITVTDFTGQRAEHLRGLIQVDATLEPGDSGGPLLDSAGRAIGMNTATSVSFRFRSRVSAGFAIPINRALAIANQIRAGRGSARVHIGPAARLGVQVTAPGEGPGGAGVRGAVIAGVVPDAPADGAGLSPGDTIVTLGGRRVSSPTGLSNIMNLHHPGDRVRVVWIDPTGASHAAVVRLEAGPPA